MNVTHIRAENYRSWRNLDLDLPQGVTAITGPNGAGKTSLLSVIDTALFGAQGSLRDYLSDGETTLLVEVTFDHAGETYRVRRSYTAKSGGKTTLDIDQWPGLPAFDGTIEREHPGWQPLTCESQKATQERIHTLIGLTPATWESSAYLRQGGGSWADPSIPPRQRKEMLAQALGLDVWDRMLQIARGDRAGVESERAKLAGQIETLTTAAARESEAQAALTNARLERDAARQRLTDLRTSAEARQARIEQALADVIAANQARQPAIEAANARAVALEEAYAAVVADANREAEAGRVYVAQRDRLQTERNRAAQEAINAHAAIDRLEADALRHAGQITATKNEPDATCHTCGQALHDEARTRTVDSLVAALGALRDQQREQAQARDAADAIVKTSQFGLDALVAPAEPDLSIVHAAKQAAQMARDEASKLAAETTQVPASIEADRKEHALEQLLADEAQRSVSEAEQRIGHADARLAQAIAAKLQAEQLVDQAKKLDADLAALDACIAAYGPNGIPALILETSAIPQLEQEANRVLAELGTEFRVELATQRAKRSSDGLIETLDVIVHSSQGARSFELFSGGEQTRINLALRLALAQLLAHRRGADVRVFLVDEPEGLDASGLERLAAVLRRLETTFDRIVVISHHQDLRDAFDQVLEVERNGDGASTLAGQLQEVPL